MVAIDEEIFATGVQASSHPGEGMLAADLPRTIG